MVIELNTSCSTLFGASDRLFRSVCVAAAEL